MRLGSACMLYSFLDGSFVGGLLLEHVSISACAQSTKDCSSCTPILISAANSVVEGPFHMYEVEILEVTRRFVVDDHL